MNESSDLQITSATFLDAFSAEWSDLISNEELGRDLLEAYSSNRKWSACMLGRHRGCEPPSALKNYLGEKGFLGKVGLRLGLTEEQVRREDYTLDCGYVGGERLIGDDHWGYASRLLALIEHENDLGSIQYEMWKLLFWRSPLKVIITYEHAGVASNGSKRLSKQVERLRHMKERVAERNPESTDVCYLLMVGARSDESELPRWGYTENFHAPPLLALPCPPR